MISKKCLACWILQSSSSCGSKERLELRRIRTNPWIRIESQNNPSEQDNESKILTPGIRYMNSLKILTKQTNCESKCWFVIIMPSKWPFIQIKHNGYQTMFYSFDSISRYVTSLLFPTLFPCQSLHSNKILTESFFFILWTCKICWERLPALPSSARGLKICPTLREWQVDKVVRIRRRSIVV
jgi:hypothetical protein